MQSSTTPLEITYLHTTSLKPDPRNPRVHSDKQIRQIAQSIQSFGFNVPLLIDEQQKVIAGHGRLMAARSAALVAGLVIVAFSLAACGGGCRCCSSQSWWP